MPQAALFLDKTIGVVTYQQDPKTGNLYAHWAFSAQKEVEITCKGIAIPILRNTENTGNTGNTGSNGSFTGDYVITYTGPDGQPDEPWDFSITQTGELYQLTWSKEGKAHYHGIGFLSGEQLVCGWRPSE